MQILVISLVSIFLAYISKYKNTRIFLILSIILLILFWGIRADFGNDYSVYLNNFNLIAESKSSIEFEFGWILLNKLFSNLGFPFLVFFVTVLQFVSINFYLKHYVGRRYRWFVLFFYIINISLMIHSLSGMRQTVAMSLLIFALHYIYKNKYLPSLIILLLAAQFHSSAYFMLVLPLTKYLLYANKKIYICVFLLIFVLCFKLKDTVLAFATLGLQFEDVSKYGNYLEQSESISYDGSGLGIILQFLILTILLIYDKFDETMEGWLLKIYQISFIFVPLYTILPIFNRIQMYFLLLGMGGTPTLLKAAKSNPAYLVVTILYILMMIMAFISVLSSGPYSIYKTIFD